MRSVRPAAARSAAIALGVAAAGLVAAVQGCAARGVAETTDRREIEQTTWNGWQAYRLSNGTAEAVVVPSIGRVMHYGYAGDGDAGNVLWTNPQLYGVAFNDGGEWQNFGGDKAWPWPQNETNGVPGWPAYFGANWPPPRPYRGVSWRAEVQGNMLTLRLPRDETYGISAMRQFILDADGTGLSVKTIFAPVTEEPKPVAPWHVTQIPRPGSTVVALGESDEPLATSWMGNPGVPEDEAAMTRPLDDVDGRRAIEVVPLPRAGKIGFDAPILAAGMERAGRALAYVQEAVVMEGGRFTDEAERAQVYVNGPDAGELVSWTELEFAAPVGGYATLEVRWTLEELEAADAQAVAAAAAQAAR